MSARAFWYTITRSSVAIHLGLALGFFAFRGPPWLAAMFLGIALYKAARILSHDDLDLRLRLRKEKRAHRIYRMLEPTEQEEILAIDRYASLLSEAGASPEVTQEVRDEAWRIVRRAGRDATRSLREYRHRLPPLKGSTPRDDAGATVVTKVERELEILRATQRELDLVG